VKKISSRKFSPGNNVIPIASTQPASTASQSLRKMIESNNKTKSVASAANGASSIVLITPASCGRNPESNVASTQTGGVGSRNKRGVSTHRKAMNSLVTPSRTPNRMSRPTSGSRTSPEINLFQEIM